MTVPCKKHAWQASQRRKPQCLVYRMNVQPIENTGLQAPAEDGERLHFCLCSASDSRLLCI